MTRVRGQTLTDAERSRIVDLYVRLKLTVPVIVARSGRSKGTIQNVLAAAGVKCEHVSDRIGGSIDGVRS